MQTIEFTAADATSELPPPMSVQEVENMTLAQKRMAAMIMETTVEDVEAHRARQAAADAEAAAAAREDDDAVMEESDDEDDETKERRRRDEEERQMEIERAKAIQASSLDVGGPMKIRTDYVPKRGLPISSLATNNSSDGFGCSVQERRREAYNVYHMRSANPGRRVARAHAYRTVGSQVEVST